MGKPKVFGIGLSRTGNKSLFKILKVLGYKPKFLPKMKDICQLNSATDISCICFLGEIIKLYPEAKFIYTTRDLNTWVTSCLNYLKPTNDAYLNYLRKEVYGNILPSRKDLIQTKARIENKIQSLEHLILNIEDENKIEKLCNYLDEPIIKIDYPHLK